VKYVLRNIVNMLYLIFDNLLSEYSTPLQQQQIFLKMLCQYIVGQNCFTLRPIALKQLNSLTTIVILSWLGGAEVTRPLWVREVPVLIPGSAKGFMFDLFCFVAVVFLLFCPKTHYLSQNLVFLT